MFKLLQRRQNILDYYVSPLKGASDYLYRKASDW